MMILTDDPLIHCTACGARYSINKEMLDYDISYIGEGSMGSQTEHDFFFDDVCKQCGQQMWFKLYAIEYPTGAWDYQDHESAGCSIDYEPTIEIEYDTYEFNVPTEYERWAYDNVSDLIEIIKRDSSVIYDITDREFEELVAEVFYRNGFTVELTPPKRDGGKDVIATRNVDGVPVCFYIECKHFGAEHAVGVGIVRSLAGVRAHDRVNKGIIVTTSKFTSVARRFAEEEKHLIQLMDLGDLLDMINRAS